MLPRPSGSSSPARMTKICSVWPQSSQGRWSVYRKNLAFDYSLTYCNHSITLMYMSYQIKLLNEFSDWLNTLKDVLTKQRLNKRLKKAQLGNLGDVQSVGGGVFEMREHFGPGWRMYYLQRDGVLIVMLAGGNKSTQQADIERAIKLAKSLED